jgi:hypothetical protein
MLRFHGSVITSNGGLVVTRGTRTARRPVGVHPLLLLLDLLPELLGYWWNQDRYLGRSILLQSYRWLADSRDQRSGERLDRLEDPFRLITLS